MIYLNENKEKNDICIDYIYDGSFEGLLSAIYDGYYCKIPPKRIMSQFKYQYEIGTDFYEVKTDTEKFNKVYSAIDKKIGSEPLIKIYNSFLSEDVNIGTMIYNYVKFGFTVGNKILLYLTDDAVINIETLSKRVSFENHRLSGLLRFHKLNSGVFYAPISPQYNVTQLLAPHFADRLPSQNWVIHDTSRKLAAFYDCEDKEWFISSFDTNQYTLMAQDNYQHELWKTFYNTIAIKERKNPNLQRQFMPKMYWKYLVEKSY